MWVCMHGFLHHHYFTFATHMLAARSNIAAVICLLTAALSNPSLLSGNPIFHSTSARLVTSTRIVNNVCVPARAMLVLWNNRISVKSHPWTAAKYIRWPPLPLKGLWLHGTLQDETGRNAFPSCWWGFDVVEGWARAHTHACWQR